MTIVSNSDMETAQKCERMFYYARILNLRPKELPYFIKRGSFGHKLMEAGVQEIINGGDIEAVNVATGKVLEELLNSGDKDTAEMSKAFRHVNVFLNWVLSDKCHWRPIAIEAATKHPLENGHVFGYTPDLVVEFMHGLYRGQHGVLDYKFLGQYMREQAINMSQQILKYIVYHNKTNGNDKIKHGAFVQLNMSADVNATGHKVFLMKWLDITKAKLARVEYENEVLVERVARLYEQTDERQFIRTVNKDVCNYCFFYEICNAQLNGKPEATVAKIIERGYVNNDYGYTDL